MQETDKTQQKTSNPGFRDGESWKTGSSAKRERMAVYVDWLLTPEADRTPPTKKELAESLGVSTQTLRNYLDDPWLQRTLVQRGRTLNKVERAQDVLEALFQQASDPTHPRSVQAAKVWLEWVNQRHEENLSQDISDLSDEELLTLLTDMATEMAESNG